MKATDLIKSIALTNDLVSGDLMVVTQYQNQDPQRFLADNFASKDTSLGMIHCTPTLAALSILNSQDYLAVINDKCLAVINDKCLVSPDGKSVLVPDYTIEMLDSSLHVFLYKIN